MSSMVSGWMTLRSVIASKVKALIAVRAPWRHMLVRGCHVACCAMLLNGAAALLQCAHADVYANTATVTDPLGTTRTYSYSTNQGRLAVISGSLPSGTGESDAASRVQDSNGLITSETDFKGVRTDTTWDVRRRLPLSVTRAAGTPEAQTVMTHWHAAISLPVLNTDSGRTISFTYSSYGNLQSRSILCRLGRGKLSCNQDNTFLSIHIMAMQG